MSPHQLAVEIENAYDFRDREKLLRALMLLVALAESHKLSAQATLLAAPKPTPPIDPSE